MNKFKFKITVFVILATFIFNITSSSHVRSTNEDDFIISLTNFHKKDESIMRILTYNLLSDGIGYSGSRVALREDGVALLINGLNPDVLAVQEMNLSWYCSLNYKLNLNYINTQKTISKTNMTSLFYNPEKLILTACGEEQYTKGSNPRLRKIVWACFKLKNCNKYFSVINTHLNLSNTENETALIQSLELTRFSKTLQKKYNSPVIITGDFNTYIKDRNISKTQSVYETLCRNFNSPDNDEINLTFGKEKSFSRNTDHIFYTGELIPVSINILSHRELNRLSDHYPLYIDIKTD